ncbi:cyclase [Streptomyces platensis]|uniref:Cyclase n=1 Tax=Streptomyces platensis TaxID=58346 RepID=A0AAE6NPH8_STRPT|nr:SRPBCC family protein [Streptomyces platensis]OSY44427.1 Polyketide cyclase / dehydrase and lipid transport [Streptomyces platensis]QEV56587.1 cyclase [Streptomyces platensis]
MAESTFRKVKHEVTNSPAAGRLKEELQHYLQARAEHAVTSLGHKLGEGVGKLAEPGRGAGGLVNSLAKGGAALGEGKSPQQAALTAGASHLKDTVKDKVRGLFGKGRKGGGGKSKSVTIVEDIDVGVPVREAYDQWTQFQEFSTFAKGVVSVEKSDDTTSNWKVKVAKSTRSWRANVTEQVPDERITWTTEGAKGTVKGVVTFHRLTDNLTRVLLVLEYFPKGLFEKTGNIWRAQGRRARLDLKLYRKFIMLRGEATDGWRGEIQDGEVVVEHADAVETEQDEENAEPGTDGDGRPDGDGHPDAEAADEDGEDEKAEDADDPGIEPEDERDEDLADEDGTAAEDDDLDEPVDEDEGLDEPRDEDDDLDEPLDEDDVSPDEPDADDDEPEAYDDERDAYEEEPAPPSRGRRTAAAR